MNDKQKQKWRKLLRRADEEATKRNTLLPISTRVMTLCESMFDYICHLEDQIKDIKMVKDKLCDMYDDCSACPFVAVCESNAYKIILGPKPKPKPDMPHEACDDCDSKNECAAILELISMQDDEVSKQYHTPTIIMEGSLGAKPDSPVEEDQKSQKLTCGTCMIAIDRDAHPDSVNINGHTRICPITKSTRQQDATCELNFDQMNELAAQMLHRATELL